MNLDPTAIHETSTPAEVLAAFQPIVETAFAEPWEARRLAGGVWGAELAVPIDEEVWAVVAASYLMVPLLELKLAQDAEDWLPQSHEDGLLRQRRRREAEDALDAAAIRLRDYWCEKRREAGA